MKAKKIIVFALALSISTIGMYTPNTVFGAETDIISDAETSESDFEFVSSCGMIANYSGDEEDVVIPSEIDGVPVKCIGVSTFKDNTHIKSVTIPDSVTEIDDFAFMNCENLTSIIIPENVTTIRGWAFKGCTSLESIKISDSVKNIGWEVFADTPWLEAKHKEDPMIIINGILLDGTDCKGEITIPDSVNVIEECAFYRCEDITSVTIPDSVTSIKDYAFMECKNLTSITIPDSVKEFGAEAFMDTPWLEEKQKEDPLVVVNGFLIDTSKCSYNITVPDSVTGYASRVFENHLGNITGVKLSDNTTSIGENLFYYCLGLKSVTIPDSVTSIKTGAFQDCMNLTSVTIPDSVTSIEASAFYNCKSLTSVTLPDSITSIAEGTFFGCESLSNITIPDSITSIENGAFYNCKNLACVTIPDSVTSIGENAFGYNFKNGSPENIHGFTIRAHVNTAAQKYAEENFIRFIPLDDLGETIKGDCNKDGVVSAADCVMIQKLLLSPGPELTDQKASDINGDEIINVVDLVLIKNMLLY